MRRNKNFRLRKLSIFLCAVLSVGLLPARAQAAAQTGITFEEYVRGSGELRSEDQYEKISLRTEEDLAEFAARCALDTWSADKKAVLENDIALSEYTDITIPVFSGIFDGGGHRITNLRLAGSGSAQGLFRYVQQGGIVRGLTVEGKIAPEGSQSRAGGIAGVNYGKILNCSFGGSVAGDNEIGGIAGANEETGEIRGCSSGAVVIGNHSTGGIAGVNHGTLNNCANTGDINTFGTEVSYNIDDFTLENLEDVNSTANVAAHTDSGGIAGLSDGKIYYCSNSGDVGYPHVGYNSGGIVGRLNQGYIQNCTNTGHVMGRKDTGGIAGQMEPFLEIKYLNDRLSELDAETDVFIELLNTLHMDVSGYGKQASGLSGEVAANLKNVSTAAGNLTGAGSDLFYIYNQELTGINNDGKILGEELDALTGSSVSGGDVLLPITVSGGDLRDWQDWIDGSRPFAQDNTEACKAALKKFGKNVSGHLGNMTAAAGERAKTVTDNLNILDKEMKAAGEHLSQLADVLQAGGDRAGSGVDALVEQARVLRRLLSGIRDDLFSYEGITVKDASDEAASRELTDVGAAGADTEAAGADAGAGAGYITEGDFRAAEEKQYDTSSFQKGKITRSVNKGSIEADTNVGGIVGQIATEFDFDPEDDIEMSGGESFDIEQTVKAVIRESRNLGDVTAKKDCAGGVAGKADFGAIISCESYGAVSSTGGSNVGGIAGVSSYAVRGCYSMGDLSGKDNVGGIAGKGCDIFYSRAYNTIQKEGECSGAIAGSVKRDGTLYDNYYVISADSRDAVGGVDGIGYAGGAMPLAYEEFCRLPELPDAFRSFTVSFLIDGREAASRTCRYGGSIPADQIPEIPEKEGYYGKWPEFDFGCITSNRVLEARYEKWVGSLSSGETGENGMPLLLAEGNFLPGAEIVLEREEELISFSIQNRADGESKSETYAYTDPVTVRVLWPENAERMQVETFRDGKLLPVESQIIGSYLQFTMETAGSFRLTPVRERDYTVWIAAGAGSAALLILILLGRAVNRRKKPVTLTESLEEDVENHDHNGAV